VIDVKTTLLSSLTLWFDQFM